MILYPHTHTAHRPLSFTNTIFMPGGVWHTTLQFPEKVFVLNDKFSGDWWHHFLFLNDSAESERMRENIPTKVSQFGASGPPYVREDLCVFVIFQWAVWQCGFFSPRPAAPFSPTQKSCKAADLKYEAGTVTGCQRVDIRVIKSDWGTNKMSADGSQLQLKTANRHEPSCCGN